MSGRPPKPRMSLNREKVLAELNANLARFDRTSARELEQQRSGQREPESATA
jgi:hypothetical protein